MEERKEMVYLTMLSAHFIYSYMTSYIWQGSNLTVARSPLATENDDGRLKTYSKVVRLATDFL